MLVDFFHFLFLGLDFIWICHDRSAITISVLDSASDISVVDFMNDQAAVLARREEVEVIETESHPLNSSRVSLDFTDLVKVGFIVWTLPFGQEFPDLDGAGTGLIS